MTNSFARPTRFMPALSDTQDRTLALLFLVLWSLATIVLQWDIWPGDLSAIYIAGALWQQGQPDLIYAFPYGFYGGAAAEWIPIRQQLGIDELSSFPYVYPPLWAVLAGPLTGIFTPQGLGNAVTCVQVPLLAASVWLAMRVLPLPGAPLWLKSGLGVTLLVAMVPTFSALWFNNPSITVNFLTLLAFERLSVNRPVAAGAALGLAAAIKLSPAIFVLIFLIDRQWRAMASFALIGGGLGVISLLVAGWPLHADFLESVRAVSDTALLSAGNISLRAALPALAAGLSLAPPMPVEVANYIIQSNPPWLTPALSIAAAALILAFGRALRHLDGPQRRGFGLLALSIIVPLFGPLGWLHYYVLPMLLLPGMVATVPMRRSLILWIALALPSLSVAFAEIDRLPWPSAHYVWLMCALWLVVLAALLSALRQLPRPLPE